MEKIIAFLIPMMATIPLTVLLCRIRIARKLRISFGTVFFSALVVTFFWLGFATQGDIYTVSFWQGSTPKPPDRPLMLKVIALMVIMCALPALGVVHYYQRRIKKGTMWRNKSLQQPTLAALFTLLVAGWAAAADVRDAHQASDAELRSRFAELKIGMTVSEVRTRMGVEPRVSRHDSWEFKLSRSSDTPEEIDWKLLVAFKTGVVVRTQTVFTCIYRKSYQITR